MLKIFSNTNFKYLLIVCAIFLIVFAIYSQVQFFSMPTDENVFADPPSKVINILPIDGFQESEGQSSGDSIPIGSLIVSINGITMTDTVSLKYALEYAPEISNVKFYDRNKNLLRTILIRKNELSKNKFSYLKSAVLILWVKPEGSSDEAGLLPGDLIISINNKEFDNAQQADELLVKSTPDSPVKYVILRGNEIVEKNVSLAKLNISLDAILRYFVSLIFLLFSLFLGLKHCEHFPIRLLSIAFLLMAPIFIPFALRGVENFFFVRLWVLVIAFSMSFSFGFLAHFLLYFPVEQKNLISRKFIVSSIYLISFAVFLLLVFSTFSRFHQLASLLSNISFIPILGYRILLNIFYRKKIIKTDKPIKRKLLVYFWFLVLFTTLFILSASNSPNYSKIFAIFFISSIGLFPFILFYSLNKYNYYGISYRIRRNFLYLLTRGLLEIISLALIIGALYILSITTIKFPNLHIVGTRIEVLNRPLPPERNIQYEKISIALLSLIFILLVIKFRTKTKNFILKKFYRTQFNYKKTANDLSELIVRNINLMDLARNVITEIQNSMFLKKAGLLILQGDKLCCVEFFNENDENLIFRVKTRYEEIFENLKNVNSILNLELLSNCIYTELSKAGYEYLLPIRYKEKLAGCLVLGQKLSETKYTNEDFEFLEIIARNIAIAIENSSLAEELAKQERLKQELEIAQRLQLASLPKEMPKVEYLSIAAIAIPALEVGGDFFDFLQKDGKLTVVVGDVSGKGISAALYMSKIQGILRTLNEFDLPLKELLVKANGLLAQNIEKNYFISAILCQFDPKTSTAILARAGHLGLYYYSKASGSVAKILPKGIVLGIAHNETFAQNIETKVLKYSKGDCFVFVTDGVIESLEGGKIISKESKLVDVITENAHLEPNVLSEKILTGICFDNQNTPLFDDLTILIVKPN